MNIVDQFSSMKKLCEASEFYHETIPLPIAIEERGKGGPKLVREFFFRGDP